MFDFIKMWLLLRALDEQENRMVAETPEYASEAYRENKQPYVNKHDFIVATSNLNLFIFLLPECLRWKIFKKSPIKRGGGVIDNRKLRPMYRLMEEASSYITTPSKKSNTDDDELKSKIRICVEKNSKTKFITSYIGGLNTLLTTNKAAWGFLVVTLLPQWLPWITNIICEHLNILCSS